MRSYSTYKNNLALREAPIYHNIYFLSILLQNHRVINSSSPQEINYYYNVLKISKGRHYFIQDI